MIVDQPLISYKKDKKKVTKKQMDDLWSKFENREGSIFKAGETISLNEFINQTPAKETKKE